MDTSHSAQAARAKMLLDRTFRRLATSLDASPHAEAFVVAIEVFDRATADMAAIIERVENGEL